MNADPIELFLEKWQRAQLREPFDATACALATCDARGRPSVRYVLCKSVDSEGFAFFTNVKSRKARDLQTNPWAALAFHWPEGAEQVRVEGTVRPIDLAQADAYFASRPRESQLGAWASRQSESLKSRAELEGAFRDVTARFSDRAVTRPPFWSGYVLRPEQIEFWKQGEHRLHTRRVYERKENGWRSRLLYP